MKVTCPYCARLQAETLGRVVRFRLGKTTHAAPGTWLMKHTATYEHEGVKPADAYLNACADWAAHCGDSQT